MNSLKICFIGVGSIAKRHINNLRMIADQRKIDLTVEALRRDVNVEEEQKLKIVKSYKDYKDLSDDYDVIFITNPTEFHMETLQKVLNKSKSFFIEKPLASVKNIDQVKKFIFPKERVYYVACPLRYTKVLQYLKKYIETKRVIGARCISSSYLPDWRPGKDYRDTYSAHRELGGGVSIDLIHEWDYIKFLFGMPEKIIYWNGKKSYLDVDCEDVALYVAECKNMFIELHLDYFGRSSIREIMIFTDEDTVIGDLINSKITFLKEKKVVEFREERDSYQIAELEHFLDILDGKGSDNSIEDAYQTIQLTQGKIEG
ncbi:MAG: Gfo/Idh/MocA family oxidoreductase [Dorea sp.]|jgi:predicted dehydrogenase|nr:Gfo/Idh/MocA family oxidoreductase [Dorea sp.]